MGRLTRLHKHSQHQTSTQPGDLIVKAMTEKFYDRHIAPAFVHAGCSMGAFSRTRELVIPQAHGVVVEAGFGSGLNLPYYDAGKIDRLIGIDPDPSMLKIAERHRPAVGFDLEVVCAGAEAMPLKTASADTVVIAYALCTIPDTSAALAEIRRILKPNGRLLFAEHGRVEQSWRGRLQDRLNGAWGRLAGGCNLNRNPSQLIEAAGFVIKGLRQERFPAYMLQLGLHSSGEAQPR